MHFAGLLFSILYGTFGSNPTFEGIVTPDHNLNSHFQLAAQFQNWSVVNQTTMFDYGLVHKAAVGFPRQELNLLLDDYYGPIIYKHSFTWIYGPYGRQELLQQQNITTFNKTAFSYKDSTFYHELSKDVPTFKTAFEALVKLAKEKALRAKEVLNSAINNGTLQVNTTVQPEVDAKTNFVAYDLLKLNGLDSGDSKLDLLDEVNLNQTFVVYNAMEKNDRITEQNTHGQFLENLPVDGALNLGLSSDTNISKSLVENLLSKTPEPVMTYWVEPKTGIQPPSSRKALFTFGSKDIEHCRDDKWVYTPQVTSTTNGWAFHINSLSVNGPNGGNISASLSKPQTAVLAKTSYWVSGPQDQVEFIADQLKATRGGLENNRFTLMKKDALQNLTISFGVGVDKLVLFPEDYLVQDPNDENLYLLIFTVKPDGFEGVDWVLGAPFLNGKCASLNPNSAQVGFTMAKY